MTVKELLRVTYATYVTIYRETNKWDYVNGGFICITEREDFVANLMDEILNPDLEFWYDPIFDREVELVYILNNNHTRNDRDDVSSMLMIRVE